MTTATPAAPEGGAVTTLPLKVIQPSGTNPRKHFAPEAMRELVESVKAHGVLQPVLVRYWPAGKKHVYRGGADFPSQLEREVRYELIAGERRWRAAKEAGLQTIPALVRELSDEQALEIQVVENLQRQDLHALEECDGYMRLRRAGYDVPRIAERVGRSVAYVYDRLRLANLTPESREVFERGLIQAGHAVLLARLSPDMQETALLSHEGVFTNEFDLFDPREDRDLHQERQEDVYAGKKARSVKELQGWIDRHVRVDFGQAELDQLFPEVAQAIAGEAHAADDEDAGEASAEPRKVVQITQESYVQQTARDGSRIIGPRSWKAATKPCQYLATGVIVIGPGRGQAFPVCIEKKRCRIHWGAEIREREKAAKAVDAASDAAGKTGAARAADRQAAERARHEEEQRKAWDRARKDIDAALAAALDPLESGALGDFLADALKGFNREIERAADRLFPRRPADATQILRHLTLLVLLRRAREWNACAEVPKLAKKLLGLDLRPIVARHAVPEPPAAPAPAAKGKAKPGRTAGRRA